MRYLLLTLLLVSCAHAPLKAPESPAQEVEMAAITVVGTEPDTANDGLAEEYPMTESEPESMYGAARRAAPEETRTTARVVRSAPVCPACPACPGCPACPACPSCPGAPEPEPPKPWWYDFAKIIGGAAGGVFAMKLGSFFGAKAES